MNLTNRWWASRIYKEIRNIFLILVLASIITFFIIEFGSMNQLADLLERYTWNDILLIVALVLILILTISIILRFTSQPQLANLVRLETEGDRNSWFQKRTAAIEKSIGDIIDSLFEAIRSIILLIIKTPSLLTPSIAHSSLVDSKYNKDLEERLKNVAKSLDLEAFQQSILINNWLDQITWTNNRATRERDTYEVIRWWMIVLGVAIPVLVNLNYSWSKNAVSIAGVFIAVLTAIFQFWRPEERWRHYRTIHERYLNEFWSFIALSGDFNQPDKPNHKACFESFHAKMLKIRQEDVAKFFSEVMPPNAEQKSGNKPSGDPCN